MAPKATMRHQLRVHSLRPGTQPEAERRLSSHREDGSTLMGSWTTDVGPLNHIVQLWANSGEDVTPDGPLKDLQAAVSIQQLTPFPFSPEVVAGAHGPVYELRLYRFRAEELARLTVLWERALPERMAVSRLVGIWYSATAPLHTLVHLWAYRSPDERSRLRAEANATRRWPPSLLARSPEESYRVESQESWLLTPSPFSPLA